MASKRRRVKAPWITRSGLILGFSATLLWLAPSHAGEKEAPPGRTEAGSTSPISTSIVEWYKPPPKNFDFSRGVELPYQLFEAVPQALIEEAAALLGDANVIPLTAQEVARFSSTTDRDAVLQTRIEEAKKKLFFFQENPVDLKLLKQYGMSGKEQKQRRRRMMDDLASEIERFQQWEGHLKPYLIKAVALQAGGHFGGLIIAEDLVIRFGAMGAQPAPMERRPVVAFLPKKPRRVYTRVGMIE